MRPTHPALVTAAVLTAAVLLPAAPAGAAPAAASPPCYGATCVGKTPYLSKNGHSCADDAVDLQTVQAPGDGINNEVTLRWSTFCHANWARWSGSDVGYADYWSMSGNGHREPPEGYYSYMVDGTQLARACVVAFTFNENDGMTACTAWK